MWKKIVAMALAVVVLLPLTACGEEELPSVQEIVGAVIEAQDDIRTYEFEVDITLDMAGEVEGLIK